MILFWGSSIFSLVSWEAFPAPLPTPAELVFPLNSIINLSVAVWQDGKNVGSGVQLFDLEQVFLFLHDLVSLSAFLTIAPTSLVLCWSLTSLLSDPLFTFLLKTYLLPPTCVQSMGDTGKRLENQGSVKQGDWSHSSRVPAPSG